jgi:hypothetical protein
MKEKIKKIMAATVVCAVVIYAPCNTQKSITHKVNAKLQANGSCNWWLNNIKQAEQKNYTAQKLHAYAKPGLLFDYGEKNKSLVKNEKKYNLHRHKQEETSGESELALAIELGILMFTACFEGIASANNEEGNAFEKSRKVILNEKMIGRPTASEKLQQFAG